jgi:hypothetical protein
LLQALEHGDDQQAEAAAEKLERDAEEEAVKAAGLEQQVDESGMTADGKVQHEQLLKELEAEMEKDEGEAENVVRGLEREEVRGDAVKMAKAINALAHQKNLGKLRHGEKVKQDVNDTLKKEGELLQVMKAGNDVAREEELGDDLGDDAESLEEDAERLYEEAEAGNFEDLDEKL